jgi:glycosyltransferase involved in cell wall biosynthesis
MRITGVVLAKNEEKKIARALESLSFCSERIVFDDSSTDATREIAEKAGARVVSHPVSKSFSDARNNAMHIAQNEWIFFLDADETVSNELKTEIEKNTWNADAYAVPRRDYFWNTELKWGETSTARKSGIVRLVKKGSGSWLGLVHETFACFGRVAKLNAFINHTPHETLSSFIHDVNAYSTLRAQDVRNEKKTVSTFELVGYPIGKFIYTYFIKLGFLDGPAGFAYSFVMAFHSFLVRSKLIMHYD